MSEQTFLSREAILAAKEKRKTIKVQDIPGMNGAFVFILEMKRAEYSEWFGRLAQSDTKSAAEVLCDESGKLQFDPANEEDLKALEECLTAKALGHIVTRAIIENSARPAVMEKNLEASLNTVLSSS